MCVRVRAGVRAHCAIPFSLPTVLRKCDCRLRSTLETLGQNVEIMSCSGDGGMYGNVVDMKGECWLAGAMAAVCWRRFKNKNPKPQHMFPAVPRDFMTHPGPSGIVEWIRFVFSFFFFFVLPASFPSSPLSKVQDHLLHVAAQGRRFFNFHVPLGFGGAHGGISKSDNSFLPQLLRSLWRQFATWVICDTEQTSGNSCATTAGGIGVLRTWCLLMESGKDSKTIFLGEGGKRLAMS